MLASNRLSSTHFARIRSFHCTVISFNPFTSPVVHFDIYTILRNQYSYPHRVCTNSPSLCLRTSCIPCCCFLLLVSPSSGTICFCTGPVFYRYLRNLLDSCWKRNHEYAGPQSRANTRIHVDTSVERQLSTLKRVWTKTFQSMI